MAFHNRADDGLTVKGRRQKGKFVREVVREIVVSGKDITSVAQPLFVIERQERFGGEIARRVKYGSPGKSPVTSTTPPSRIRVQVRR